MSEPLKYVLWQRQGAGSWTRATDPVPLFAAEQMRLAAVASGGGVEYQVLLAGERP